MKDKIQRKLNSSAARTLNRREFLFSLGSSIGAVAFSNLLVQDGVFAEPANPLVEKPQMIPAKAKSCIFLMMEGGPSHIDTFDPKPKLHEFHMKRFDRSGKEFSAMSSGNRYYVESPFSNQKVGRSGADMCEHFAKTSLMSRVIGFSSRAIFFIPS